MLSSPGDGFSVQPCGRAMFMLSGELDMATRPVLDGAIEDAVAAGGPILLDVSGLGFIDAAGIHAISKALDGLPSGCIVLHGVRGEVQRVLDVVGIEQTPTLHIVPCTEPHDAVILDQRSAVG